jgi:acetamidase/formamidase
MISAKQQAVLEEINGTGFTAEWLEDELIVSNSIQDILVVTYDIPEDLEGHNLIPVIGTASDYPEVWAIVIKHS